MTEVASEALRLAELESARLLDRAKTIGMVSSAQQSAASPAELPIPAALAATLSEARAGLKHPWSDLRRARPAAADLCGVVPTRPNPGASAAGKGL